MQDDFEGIAILQLSKDDERNLYRLNVLGKDGKEHGIAHVGNETIEFSSGLEDKVYVSDSVAKLIRENPARTVTLYHNHPNGTAPSGEDLKKLISRKVGQETIKPVKAVLTIGANGNVHKIEVGDGYIPPEDEFDEFVEKIGRELTDVFTSEVICGSISAEEANYLFAKEQAYKIAREFKWLYDGGRL